MSQNEIQAELAALGTATAEVQAAEAKAAQLKKEIVYATNRAAKAELAAREKRAALEARQLDLAKKLQAIPLKAEVKKTA